MADTGYNWDANWTTLDAATVLTQGGTTTDTSIVIDCDGKAVFHLSVDTDYSNHAKATGGLFIYILKDINGTDYETEADGPWGFEMAFLQAGTRRWAQSFDVRDITKIKVHQDWDNSTGSSVATTATLYKFATIPPAS